MSILMAVSDHTGVWIGSDSYSETNYIYHPVGLKWDLSPDRTWAVGNAGTFSYAGLLFKHADPFPWPEPDGKQGLRQVLFAIRSRLELAGLKPIVDNDEVVPDWRFSPLVACSSGLIGRCYSSLADLSEPYFGSVCVAGAGEDLALAAAYVLRARGVHGRQLLEGSMQVACELSTACQEPLHVLQLAGPRTS